MTRASRGGKNRPTRPGDPWDASGSCSAKIASKWYPKDRLQVLQSKFKVLFFAEDFDKPRTGQCDNLFCFALVPVCKGEPCPVTSCEDKMFSLPSNKLFNNSSSKKSHEFGGPVIAIPLVQCPSSAPAWGMSVPLQHSRWTMPCT